MDIRVFRSTAYLLLESATPQCGKTTVLELLEALCKSPTRVTCISPAALFRIIEKKRPTLLVDEAEVLLQRGDRAENIRAIAQAGYKRGGTVIRCVGDLQEPHEFEVYCPKAFASIKGLKGALLDRCIPFRMERAPVSCTLVRTTQLDRDAAPLVRKLEAYALRYREQLKQMYAEQPNSGYWPESLRGREEELWTPLLLNARIAGSDVESEALGIARTFSGRKQLVQAQDRDIAMARDLFELLMTLGRHDFSPGEFRGSLSNTEVWGSALEYKGDKAQAMYIAEFLRRYGASPIRHDRLRGSIYSTADVVERLRKHLPQQNPGTELSEIPLEVAMSAIAESESAVT